jgi:hypothetical protein
MINSSVLRVPPTGSAAPYGASLRKQEGGEERAVPPYEWLGFSHT